jgi:ESS family glutamate:Na+ symporter
MTFSLQEILWAGIVLAGLLLVGEWLVRACAPLRRIYLPASIVAGALALLLGPQVLGRFQDGPEGEGGAGLFTEAIVGVWSGAPGILISIVFATLLMGKPVPTLRRIWSQAGPQVCFGQTLAWGQYVVGILLTMLVLTPVFGLPVIAGTLIEIGFEGGHGTAAGMGQAFAEAGWPEGQDLALGLATIGLVSGVILGTVLINWAARRGTIHPEASFSALEGAAASAAPAELTEAQRLEYWREREAESKPTDPLSLHLGLIGLAIAIGWVILEGLRTLETRTWASEEGAATFFTHVPLFPLAMIGGVIIQITFDKLGKSHVISSRTLDRIGGGALDFTIVAALGALSLRAIGDNLVPFLLLAVAGIVWALFAIIVIAPKIIPDNWFERGIGDFGQSMGVTVTGLLLMRVADPKNESGALQSFGYKQLMFEPIVGGGLFTGASVALLLNLGPLPVLAITAAAGLFWLILGMLVFGKRARANRATERAQRAQRAG